MRHAYILISPTAHHYTADLLAYALADCLKNLKFAPAILIREHSILPPTTRHDLIINIGRGMDPRFTEVPGIKIIFNIHPVAPNNQWGRRPKDHFFELVNAAKRVDWVFEYGKISAEWLKNFDVSVKFTPIGYHPFFENYSRARYPFGVYFIGVPRKDRAKKLQKCGAVIYEGGYQGLKQRLILNSPGVHLNLFHTNWRPFLSLRIIALLLSNKRCVLTERSDWSPLTDGEHYISSDRIVEKCEFLKERPKFCNQLGDQGYEFIKRHHRLDQAIEKSLSEAAIL